MRQHSSHPQVLHTSGVVGLVVGEGHHELRDTAANAWAIVPMPPWWTNAAVRGKRYPNGRKSKWRTPSGSCRQLFWEPRQKYAAAAHRATHLYRLGKDFLCLPHPVPKVNTSGEGPASRNSWSAFGTDSSPHSS